MTEQEEFNIDEVFESAVAIVRNLPKEGPIKPSDELKLKLYAYFKQATHGPNDTPKPRFYQFVESYKWDAWHKLGDMSRGDAMSNYIHELKQIMDTIPKDAALEESNQHFEEILGKKFYDYWFDEWSHTSQSSTVVRVSRDVSSGRDGATVSTNLDDPTTSTKRTRANDTQSNSSGGSSMSMLEETQSPDGDGYKTPISLEECNIAGQSRDQFALAVLRLQHGLDETNSRLSKIESQLMQSLESIRSLESQTFPKRPLTAGTHSGYQQSSSSTHASGRSCFGRLINFVSRLDTVHWFYLSYPIIVYVLLQKYENRRRRISR